MGSTCLVCKNENVSSNDMRFCCSCSEGHCVCQGCAVGNSIEHSQALDLFPKDHCVIDVERSMSMTPFAAQTQCATQAKEEWRKKCADVQPHLKQLQVWSGPPCPCTLLTPDTFDAPEFSKVVTARDTSLSLNSEWSATSLSTSVRVGGRSNLTFAKQITLFSDVSCKVKLYIGEQQLSYAQEWTLAANETLTTPCSLPISISRFSAMIFKAIRYNHSDSCLPMADEEQKKEKCILSIVLSGLQIGREMPFRSQDECFLDLIPSRNGAAIMLPTCLMTFDSLAEGYVDRQQDVLESLVRRACADKDFCTVQTIEKWSPAPPSSLRWHMTKLMLQEQKLQEQQNAC